MSGITLGCGKVIEIRQYVSSHYYRQFLDVEERDFLVSFWSLRYPISCDLRQSSLGKHWYVIEIRTQKRKFKCLQNYGVVINRSDDRVPIYHTYVSAYFYLAKLHLINTEVSNKLLTCSTWRCIQEHFYLVCRHGMIVMSFRILIVD